MTELMKRQEKLKEQNKETANTLLLRMLNSLPSQVAYISTGRSTKL